MCAPFSQSWEGTTDGVDYEAAPPDNIMLVIFNPHCEKLEEPNLIRVLTPCAVRDLQRTDMQMRLLWQL